MFLFFSAIKILTIFTCLLWYRLSFNDSLIQTVKKVEFDFCLKNTLSVKVVHSYSSFLEWILLKRSSQYCRCYSMKYFPSLLYSSGEEQCKSRVERTQKSSHIQFIVLTVTV